MQFVDLLFITALIVGSVLLSIGYRTLASNAPKHSVVARLRKTSSMMPVVVIALVFAGILLPYGVVSSALLSLNLLVVITQLLMLPLALMTSSARKKLELPAKGRAARIAVAFLKLVSQVTVIVAAFCGKVFFKLLSRSGRKHTNPYDPNAKGNRSPHGHYGHLTAEEQALKDGGMHF